MYNKKVLYKIIKKKKTKSFINLNIATPRHVACADEFTVLLYIYSHMYIIYNIYLYMCTRDYLCVICAIYIVV